LQLPPAAAYRSDASGSATVVTEPLGAEIQGLAFSSGFGFGEWLYALLADGRIVRVAADGTVEPFLTGIAESTNPNAPVRNDLCFTVGGDRLYLTDAVRRVIYQVHYELPVDGRGVASGVYVVRLDGDGETSVRKITLVK
jgi:hypothetical protein